MGTRVTQLSCSLRCPITGQRLKVPGRGASCEHVQCFDLVAFLHHPSQRLGLGGWLCPVCERQIPTAELRHSPLLAEVLSSPLTQNGPSREGMVEVFPDGTWRVSSRKRAHDAIVIDD
eukprot:RCo046571